MPLVLVMMIAAVVRMREVADLGLIGSSVVGILVGTTAVAALVGIFVSNFFGLSADAITQGARELERAASSPPMKNVANLGLADTLVRFIPSNIFSDLTGARPTSIIAVVIFGILFGLAALGVAKEDPAGGEASGSGANFAGHHHAAGANDNGSDPLRNPRPHDPGGRRL